MLVRSKQRDRATGWRRQAHAGQGGTDRLGAAHQSPAPRERRHGGPSQDRALYTCECGYAFEALVTTSVGCPHCARMQAW
jgi:hypothetical protein